MFHYALPKYLLGDLERVQKRASGCIFPGISYSTVIVLAGISLMYDHHDGASYNGETRM